jgi:hypothetical protein
MAYLPKEHIKYKLLSTYSGEVFVYPSELIWKIEEITGALDLIPYGYKTYKEYYKYVDDIIKQYSNNKEVVKLLIEYKNSVKELNIKEDWSILKYVGESTNNIFGLTNGKMYYWPTSKKNPIYQGVVDNEEFTSYLYPTDARLWEIIEDPTGMAFNTIYNNSDSKIDKNK